MVVKLQDADGVKVYNLTAAKVLPAWAQKGSRARGKPLHGDADFGRHVELLQDFGFPSAAHAIKATRDGANLFATGVHAPRLRVYELADLSLKFERHFDAEIIDFQVRRHRAACCAARERNYRRLAAQWPRGRWGRPPWLQEAPDAAAYAPPRARRSSPTTGPSQRLRASTARSSSTRARASTLRRACPAPRARSRGAPTPRSSSPRAPPPSSGGSTSRRDASRHP
jgi:hypothetical protein